MISYKRYENFAGACPILFEADVYSDDRGLFLESYRSDQWSDIGPVPDFVQENVSITGKTGTIRGLHFQKKPAAQAKLVSCLAGKLFDVFVDARSGSPTYGMWDSIMLQEADGKSIYIPDGFLHGFQSLAANTCMQYKCSNYYNKLLEGAVYYADEMLGIEWPVSVSSTSDKDKNAMSFREFTNSVSL